MDRRTVELGSVTKADENMGMSNPNIFNSTWNLGHNGFFESNLSFADIYQVDLATFDGSTANQTLQLTPYDSEPIDHLTGPIEPQFQSGMQPHSSASLILGLNELLAISIDPWTTGVEPYTPMYTNYLENEPDRKLALIHGQITPGDSLQEGDEPTSRKGSTSFPGVEATHQTTQLAGQVNLKDFSVKNVEAPSKVKKSRKSKKKPITEEQEKAKHKRFLERNRVAANKCRQKRKKWVDVLQEKCHRVSADNAIKDIALEEMGKEIIQFKKILLMHSESCKDDSVKSPIDGEARKG